MLRRRGLLVLLAVVLLLFGAIVGCWIAIPFVIHRQLLAALTAAGFDQPELRVRKATLWGLEVADLRFGASKDRVDAVSVDYSPGKVLRGRAGRVQIRGIELSASFLNGKLDLDALSGLASKPSATSKPSALKVPIERIDIVDSFVNLELSNQSLRFAVSGSVVPQADRQLQIDFKLMQPDFPLTISGRIGPMSDQLDLSLSGTALSVAAVARIASAVHGGLALSAGGTLDLDAHISRREGKTDVSADVVPNAAAVTIGAASAAQKPANVTGIGGVYHAEARFAEGAPLGGLLSLTNSGWQSDAASASGVNGTITFEDWTKLITAPTQRLAVDRLTIGKLELAKGATTFGLHGTDKINVAETHWSWLGGYVSAENVSIRASRFAGTLVLQDVDLKAFFAAFLPGTATGAGKISGRIPAYVDWPKVQFGDGTLTAGPGGNVQVKNLKSLSSVMDQASHGASNQLTKQKALEALSDMDYDVLSAQLHNSDKGLSADVHMAGRGRKGLRQAVDLELRLNGIGELLDWALGLDQRLSKLKSGK